MGKARKIIIDDTIPCTKEGENLLPRCTSFNEFWPLIITKAIIKLFSFKFKSTIFSRKVVGDIQLFYTLTGYIPEIVNFDILKKASLNLNGSNNNCDLIKHFISQNIHDDNFFYKKNFLMVFYNSFEDDNLNIEKQLFKKSVNDKIKMGVPKKILFLESSIKKIGYVSDRVNLQKKLTSNNFLFVFFIEIIKF